jgi:hypothetical protein
MPKKNPASQPFQLTKEKYDRLYGVDEKYRPEFRGDGWYYEINFILVGPFPIKKAASAARTARPA